MKPGATTALSSGRTGDLERRKRRSGAAIRYVLGALLAFAALNALAGGYYGLTGAKGVPREWLRGNRFPDYFVPSLILVVTVGGSFLLATAAVFARWRHGRLFAIAAALVLVLAWRLPSAARSAGWRERTT